MRSDTLVTKIWSFCDTLRDDGLGYGDYLEQLTYLLFLKMADENHSEYQLPKICEWKLLVSLEKGQLMEQYEVILKTLSRAGGMLTKIFAGAQNKIHDSAKLKKLIKLIDEENWTTTQTDIKGEIYESLLQKNAESSGAGQYFTPRPVIAAIVECIDPKISDTIADPACGTGGFFLGVLEHLSKTKRSKSEIDFLKFRMFHGWEIENATARLCLMNLFLHGIGDLKKTPNIEIADSLKNIPQSKQDIVLANPPFGKSSSDIPTIDRKLALKEGYFLRNDFWATTSNKQLAFIQHIFSMLKEGGRAAVVLPDNVLFEGGAGEVIRRKLLQETDLHTILRLPTGIFYAHGVKSNVLFFEKKKSSKKSSAQAIWIYDYRTNIRHTPKKNPLRADSLQEFIACYKQYPRKETWKKGTSENGRWKKFTYAEILNSDKVNLDIFWLNETNSIHIENLPPTEILLDEIIDNIESALLNLKTIKESLE